MSIWVALGLLGLLVVVVLVWAAVSDLRRLRDSQHPNSLAMDGWERVHGKWRG